MLRDGTQVDLDEVLNFVRELIPMKKPELERMVKYPPGTVVYKMNYPRAKDP